MIPPVALVEVTAAAMPIRLPLRLIEPERFGMDDA